MSTLDTLLSKFNNDVRINKSFKLWTSDVVTEFINQAYFQVQKDGNFDWSQNQASAVLSFSNNEADVPSDFITVNLVKAGDVTLERGDKLEMVDRNIDLTAVGSPSKYYLYGGKIGLDKVPNSTVTIYYRKQLPDLTSVVNSELPARFDKAIVKYAAYLGFSTYLPNDQRGELRLRDYEMQINTVSNYQIDDSSVTFNYSR